jgi:hypothetical protein
MKLTLNVPSCACSRRASPRERENENSVREIERNKEGKKRKAEVLCHIKLFFKST